MVIQQRLLALFTHPAEVTDSHCVALNHSRSVLGFGCRLSSCTRYALSLGHAPIVAKLVVTKFS